MSSIVKVWNFDNSDLVYGQLKKGLVLCLQLESGGFPVDFLVLNNLDEFTGKEFRDSEWEYVTWIFGVPARLVPSLALSGALFNLPNYTSFPEHLPNINSPNLTGTITDIQELNQKLKS